MVALKFEEKNGCQHKNLLLSSLCHKVHKSIFYAIIEQRIEYPICSFTFAAYSKLLKTHQTRTIMVFLYNKNGNYIKGFGG